MTKTTLTIAAALLTAFGLSAVATAGPGHDHGGASATLEAFKKLEGTWVRVDDAGNPTDEVVSVYRVTAGGSAVIETMFPGTEKEMVTVYHRDGDDVVLTHYCMMGNQPQLRAKAGGEAQKVVFQCAGGMNMASENDHHMHHAEFLFVGPDRLTAEWTSFKDGKQDHVGVFQMARRKG